MAAPSTAAPGVLTLHHWFASPAGGSPHRTESPDPIQDQDLDAHMYLDLDLDLDLDVDVDLDLDLDADPDENPHQNANESEEETEADTETDAKTTTDPKSVPKTDPKTYAKTEAAVPDFGFDLDFGFDVDLDADFAFVLTTRKAPPVRVEVPESDTGLGAWIARRLNARDPAFLLPFFDRVRADFETSRNPPGLRIGDAPLESLRRERGDVHPSDFAASAEAFAEACRAADAAFPRAAVALLAVPTYGRFVANAFLSYVHEAEFATRFTVLEHPYDSRAECVFSRNTVGGARTGNIVPLLYTCCDSCKSRLVAGEDIPLDPAATPKFAYPKLLRSFGYAPARMTLKFLDVRYKASERPRKEPIKAIEVEMEDASVFFMKTGPKDIDHNAGSNNVNLTLTPVGRKLTDPVRSHVLEPDAEVYACPCADAKTALTFQTLNNVPDAASTCPVCATLFAGSTLEATVCKACSDASTLYLTPSRDAARLVCPEGSVDIFLPDLVLVPGVPEGPETEGSRTWTRDESGLPPDEAVLVLRAQRRLTGLLPRSGRDMAAIARATRRRRRRCV
eukprot:jgi/Tetstr1/447343/TSEL_034780.t1